MAAIDALAKRASAHKELSGANEILTAAIRSLEATGFSRDDLAEVLGVPVDELADRPAAGPKRPPRPGRG